MLYKAVLNGQCQSQDVKNILWYRTGLGVDIEGLTFGGTEDLARGIQAMVVPSLLAVLTSDYHLQDIQVYGFDQSTFNLLYQNPFTLGVNGVGTVGGDIEGPATCAILRFDLEPTALIVNGPKPPKKGYLAIGPLSDAEIGGDGSLERGSGFGAKWDALTAAMSSNVETIIPPAVFFPIRVHQTKVLGLFHIDAFADIKNATMRNGTSFRRSRVPEL